MARQFDEVVGDGVVERLERLGGLVEIVVTRYVEKRRRGRVDPGSQPHYGCVTKQFVRATSYQIGVTGTESDDSNDRLHL